MFKSIQIQTQDKMTMVEVIDPIREFIAEQQRKTGILIVTVPHTTASIILHKNYDEEIQSDFMRAVQRLAPQDIVYQYIEGNSPAQIITSILGNSLTLIVNDGHIELGMFQSVFLCEFDGARKRSVYLKFIAD